MNKHVANSGTMKNIPKHNHKITRTNN